jgi:hypothetical protein
MKKLLIQFDTDPHAAVFDSIVAYDGGADHVLNYGGITPENVIPLVEGCIFTRSNKDKKNTAIFVGGSNMNAGQQLFAAIQKAFISEYNFQVSIMLDSNGSNTTAAAAVAKMAVSSNIKGKKAVVLAGTGPVGQRAAAMLAQQGAEVSLTSRSLDRATLACTAMRELYNVNLTPISAVDDNARGRAIEQANIVFSTGAAGKQLLKKEHWENNQNIEMIADANATPPLGIGGIEMFDKGTLRNGKIIWGAIGFGALKIALHRRCIANLFETNTLVLDAPEILELAKEMA